MAFYGSKRAKNKDIPIDALRKVFEYDHERGLITKIDRTNSPKGTKVGYDMNGYKAFGFEGRTYYVHRVVWALVNGSQPNEIDHINGDKTDNRIDNLRSVNRSENIQSYYNSRGVA